MLFIFSFSSKLLVKSPALPDGPVIKGGVSSISVTVMLTAWSEVFPAKSVACKLNL